MLTVSEHVYDEATGIDHYVFEPGAMKAQVKVTETNGEPQVWRAWPSSKAFRSPRGRFA